MMRLSGYVRACHRIEGMVQDRSSSARGLPVYFESGQRVELVNSKTLCGFLGISKPETLLEMAHRGDLPSPIHLNMQLKGRKGRNQVRWNLPAVVRHLGLAQADI